MLRAFLARVGLTSLAEQLELAFDVESRPAASRPSSGATAEREIPVDAHVDADARTTVAPVELLQRLRSFGLRGIEELRLTRNRTTMVSFRGATLRVHEAFATAPDDVQRAIAVFVSGRGAARRAARRTILAFRLPGPRVTAPRRREATLPDDRAMADRLTQEHARLNALHFGSRLRPIDVRVSRRMKSRLGHYAPGGSVAGDIVISRRHIRRHGWSEAIATLLHEMVHQWQEESGIPLDHGPAFRRKAKEVGVVPRARRALR